MIRLHTGILIFLIIIDGPGINGGGGESAQWDYYGPLGPSKWHTLYPQCSGNHQSPISFRYKDVSYLGSLEPITFRHYSNIHNVWSKLLNNGHTVEVDLEGKPISISGGNLSGEYRAQQFHFHWGAKNERGSEHEINRHRYPMEMHIVHYNQRYKDFKRALSEHDGLAVLAFFFKIGAYNPNLDEIISYLHKVKHEGDKVHMDSFPLSSLLPTNVRDYYRYHGSLTTPPCFESVTWTIFKSAVDISEAQLNYFRLLVTENADHHTTKNNNMYDYFRPVQPIHNRPIYSSDPKDYRQPSDIRAYRFKGKRLFTPKPGYKPWRRPKPNCRLKQRRRQKPKYRPKQRRRQKPKYRQMSKRKNRRNRRLKSVRRLKLKRRKFPKRRRKPKFRTKTRHRSKPKRKSRRFKPKRRSKSKRRQKFMRRKHRRRHK